MSDATSRRNVRKSRPGVEGLEGRELLSTSAGAAGVVEEAAVRPLKQFSYTTPQGTRVALTLYGKGSLAGTSVDSRGVLDLEFSGTNEQSGILSRVHGGDGHPKIKLLKFAGLPTPSQNGVGSTLIDVVRLRDFDLVDGGRVNLTGGAHVLFLHSIGAGTQVSLREIPPSLLPAATTTTATGTTGTGTTGTTTTTTAIPATGTVTQNGVTQGFAQDATGARTLVSVGGTFVPGTNLAVSPLVFPNNPNSIVKNPGAPPAPPGVIVSIDYVNGPARSAQGIGPARVFGYDAATNTLTRFDVTTDPTTAATTGTPSLAIPDALPGAGPNATAALGRNRNELVVLVGDGRNVSAYDATTGAPAGHFSLASLTTAAPGSTPLFDPANPPTNLGTYDAFTVIGSPTGGANGLGRLATLDVTASLATGSATLAANTLPFNSAREFGLSGGFGSVPGSGTLSAVGGGFFDPFQPNVTQRGLATLSPGAVAGAPSFRESSRTALTGLAGASVPSGPHGAVGSNPSNALGSLDQSLALVTASDPVARTNTVSLYNPQTAARTSTLTLNGTPNRLTSLTASFRPDVAGSALVDVQGNTQSFRAVDARGLVFNGLGNVNLVKIHRATDTTVIGYPFGHAEIPFRNNVRIVSSGRTVGTRNGVTVVPAVVPTGPLSQP